MATTARTKEDIFEMFLRQAVIDCVHREAEEFAAMETPDEAEIASSSRAKKTRDLCLREDRRERFRRKTIPRLRRMTVAAAVALSILTGSMLAYPAVRAAVADVFVEWFDQFTQFTGMGAESSSTDKKWELSIVPSGYVEVDRVEGDSRATVRYENKSGELLLFAYQQTTGTIGVDNEDMIHRTHFMDDVTYDIFESQDIKKPSSIVWDSEGYMFSLSSFESVDTLLEMAFSVTEK